MLFPVILLAIAALSCLLLREGHKTAEDVVPDLPAGERARA
jgi:hypothetical protein